MPRIRLFFPLIYDRQYIGPSSSFHNPHRHHKPRAKR